MLYWVGQACLDRPKTTKKDDLAVVCKFCSGGGHWIRSQLCKIFITYISASYCPKYTSTMGYWDKLSAPSPSQSSHTILSVSHRCNFLVAKMHQKRPYLHIYNLLITNKIIIILPILTFSLERFFSIFSLLRCYQCLDYAESFYKYPQPTNNKVLFQY